MDLSVIIATRNRAAWLPTCLTHLEQQTFPAAGFEIVVADCGSEDNTCSILDRFASGSPVRIRPMTARSDHFAAARNEAVVASAGRLLLFLADDELASPRLVENHVRAHDASPVAGCLMGTINRHPQLPAETVTRHYFRRTQEGYGSPDAIPYTNWTASNFSLPRALFDLHGGYVDDGRFLTLEHVELAYRMSGSGVEGMWVEDARSYIWQPAQLDEERFRAYQEGFSLYNLAHATRDRSLLPRFRLVRSPAQRVLSRFLLPFYLRTCRQQEKENKLFVGTLYRQILHHERLSGFEDASNGRPRRPPGNSVLSPAPSGHMYYI